MPRKPWWAVYEEAREKRSSRPDSPAEIRHELDFAEECQSWLAGGGHDCT